MPSNAVKKTISALIMFVFAGIAFGEGAKVDMASQEQWSNIFGGKEVIFHLALKADEAIDGCVAWQFSAAGGTIARNEKAIHIEPQVPSIIEIPLQVPSVKDGVVMQAQMSVSFSKTGGSLSTNLQKTLWIFPEDPFTGKTEWLKKLNIHLFDPEKKTAEMLSKAGVPFESIINIDAFDSIGEGMLIIGEGISFQDYKGLGQMAVKSATSGIPVLFLAPAGGEIPLPGMGETTDLPEPQRVILKRNDAITDLDKRLDAQCWSPDGRVVVSTLVLSSNKEFIAGRVKKGGDGWPWVEMKFDNKHAKLIICGFGIIEKWDAGPSARFLFGKLLECLENSNEIQNRR